MKYGNLTLGQVEAAVNKLGGYEVVRRILRGGDLTVEMMKLLDAQDAGNNSGTVLLWVDKNDRSLKPFNPKEFSYIDSGIKPKDFPLRGNSLEQRRFFVINLWERFPDHDPTTAELLTLIMNEAGGRPDFAETKAFLRDHRADAMTGHPLISLCGSIVVHSPSNKCEVGCLIAGGMDERRLSWSPGDYQWDRKGRLLISY